MSGMDPLRVCVCVCLCVCTQESHSASEIDSLRQELSHRDRELSVSVSTVKRLERQVTDLQAALEQQSGTLQQRLVDLTADLHDREERLQVCVFVCVCVCVWYAYALMHTRIRICMRFTCGMYVATFFGAQ